MDVECQHHEVATAGQCEIDSALQHAAEIRRQHDEVQVDHQERGQSVRQDGHLHAQADLRRQRLRHAHPPIAVAKAASRFSPATSTPAFRSWRCGTQADCSSTARSLAAFIAPTTNSYKRLVPGYEAPVNLAYSSRNRSAAVRIPVYSNSPKAKRLEFRPPDPSCNPYLAFAAMLMAGLDGIKNKIDPGKPLDKDIFELVEGRAEERPSMPGSLDEALERSGKRSRISCSKGGVFTKDLIDTWIEYKRKNEADPVRMRPHPYEFHLYYDI